MEDINKAIPIRLTKEDVNFVDFIVKTKKLFKNRADFIRFAIKSTVLNVLNTQKTTMEIIDRMAENSKLTESEAEKISKEINDIREELWE